MLDFGSFRFDTHPQMSFRIVNDGNARLDMMGQFVGDTGTENSEISITMRRATIETTQFDRDEVLDITVIPQVNRRIGLVSGHIDLIARDPATTPPETVGQLLQVPVTGTATAANVKIPASVAFGVVDVNQPAPQQTITIENTGNEMLDITALRVTSPDGTQAPNPAFSFQLPGTPAHVAPGQMLDVPVVYGPTVVTGDAPDIVILNVDLAGTLNATATVQITGEAATTAFSFHGGGGCAAGSPTSAGAALPLLVALLAGLTRRHRRARSRTALVLVFAGAGTSAAHADDVLVGVYQPTPATRSTSFQLESPEVGAAGSWAAATVASYASDLLVLDTVHNGTQLRPDRAIRGRTMVGVGGAYAFLGRFEAGLWLPMYRQRGDEPSPSQNTAAYIAPARGTALGDLTLHGKLRLVRLGNAALGATLHVTLPTASSGQFTGVDLPTVRALGLVAWSPQPGLTLSASAGGVLRKTSVHRDTASLSQGSGLPWGAGIAYQVRDRWSATAEVFGEIARGGDRDMTTLALAPIEGLVGLRYRAGESVVLGVAAGRGLSDGIGAPAARGVASLSYEVGAPRALPGPAERRAPDRDSDSDGDGIVDRLDRCPQAREDRDGFQDDDGCPDPDNDGDGIADAADRCPNQAEDKDGFQDDDGCLDPDNDGDGIADTLDRCPGEAETVNGKDDADGCPDSTAAAPAGSPASPAGSPVRAAEAAFTRGRALMAEAKYAEACEAFQQSQRLDPQFGTQYNLAGCSEKTGKLATAWALYRQLARSDPHPTRRARSAQLAAALAARVPRLRITLPARLAGVRVTLNGADATALVGADTPVDFGHYTIAAVAIGYWAWQQTVEITRDSQIATIAIDLQPTH